VADAAGSGPVAQGGRGDGDRGQLIMWSGSPVDGCTETDASGADDAAAGAGRNGSGGGVGSGGGACGPIR
jgi:hypothetical protein